MPSAPSSAAATSSTSAIRGGNHESIRTEILAAHDATGLTDAYRRLADQCLAEYDLDGWTVPDLVDPDDVNIVGKFDLHPQAGR